MKQSEVILHCCRGRLLCFGPFLANWPLLTCVSECFRVIWGGVMKGLSFSPLVLSWVQGGGTLGTHLPGTEPLVLPPAGSARPESQSPAGLSVPVLDDQSAT